MELPSWECVLGVHWTLELRYKRDSKSWKKAVVPEVAETGRFEVKKRVFPPNMTNSGAPGGLPMTHRAGGEFHGPLGHASSDLSEIASRKQNFWGIFEGPDVSKRIHFRPKTFVCSLLDSEAFWATSEVADTVAYGSMHYLKPLSEPKPNGTSRLEIEAVDQSKDCLSC